MENSELKAKLLEACIKVQTEHLRVLKEEIVEAEKIANDNDSGAEENMNSFREEMQNKREVFTRQFLIANNDLQLLHRMDNKIHDGGVQLGSVVYTETQKLYISVSLGKVEVDGVTYFSISTQTPLYKVLMGKNKGDSASLNGKEVKLVEVF